MDRTLINEHKASEVVGFTVKTLRKRRNLGQGPTYYKIGSKVLYDLNDLHKFLETSIVKPRLHMRKKNETAS